MNLIEKQNAKIDGIFKHIGELTIEIERLEKLADLLQAGVENVSLCPDCSGFIVCGEDCIECDDCEKRFTADEGNAQGEIILSCV